MSILALDLGGTKLGMAIFSTDGKIQWDHAVTLEGRSGDDVGKFILDQIERCVSRQDDIATIGISIPGISRQKTGTVWAPNIRGWDDYPLVELIQRANPGLKVRMDSDRACSMLGEQWQGNARGCRNAIFIAVGTGIGAGILVDGQIIRGAEDIAGAVGWMALMKPFEKKYTPCGCFEYYASGEGIARYASEMLNERDDYQGSLRERKQRLTARDVFKAYDEKDELANAVIGGCVEFWGMAAANFVSIFNPEKIIFGGGIFGPATRFIPAIYKEASKWAQPISIQSVRFEPSALGGKAALYGAGYLALRSIQPD